LKQFKSAAATVLTFKDSFDWTFTDYKDSAVKGLMPREGAAGENSPAYLRARESATWLLQCVGKYSLEIGDELCVSINEAREAARRLRAGDERATIEAYIISRDPCDPSAGSDEEKMFGTVSLAQVRQIIAHGKTWAKTLTRAQAADWKEIEYRLRVHRLEAVLRKVCAFAAREGLRFAPRLRLVTGQDKARRAGVTELRRLPQVRVSCGSPWVTEMHLYTTAPERKTAAAIGARRP
jgi:hypothetical protein